MAGDGRGNATILRRTAQACTAFLSEHLDADWTARVEVMGMTVAEVVAHIGNCLTWYAHDLAAGPAELSTLELEVKADSPLRDLVATLATGARVLGAVVATTRETERGWHPFGLADPSGFAAMGCDELLVHTADAATGLGTSFEPDSELAAATLHRLFPWAPTDVDAWNALLWANGRIELPGRPRLARWRWHCAPLSEWDGVPPVEPA
ncbi:maleylpyruvate isomerase N-terminal domain-containing protein [Amycolatopsis taiwanensis]|uniref:Mycothiol-dependent maleylpyruvate isomerase metal-binding domain-containing protein n=1 Tax=Amycolatopsis taiwanensis TaxID=342230 RepID=A0A9W6VFQ4_9PSEU|nr:maleylpyruvate isomerase N-terminal domain-containing protein [Amycolatopsis taiwanensis]GLY67025.1 hypothetical protein Atai01_36440 [Amycolatopsis taiwanensis]